MATFTKGEHAVTTDVPTEMVTLSAQGWAREDAPEGEPKHDIVPDASEANASAPATAADKPTATTAPRAGKGQSK